MSDSGSDLRRAGRWSIILVIIGMAFSSLGPMAAGKVDDSEGQIDAALRDELKSLEQKLAKIEDLKAKITQHKHVALLKAPLISSGVVLVKGGRMRWDIVKPSPSTTLTSADEIRIHYPEQKVVEIYRVDQRVASVIATPIPQLVVLLRHFHIERMPTPKDADEKKQLDIRLTPRNEELKKHIERIMVTIDRESAFTRRMEMVDVDGDRTVIDFEEIAVNNGLKARDFELELPAGTRIVRPLESAEKVSP